MPKSGGLQDVSQRFTADVTGYHDAAEQVVLDAIRMASGNKDLAHTFKDLEGAIGAAAVQAGALDRLGDSFKNLVGASGTGRHSL